MEPSELRDKNGHMKYLLNSFDINTVQFGVYRFHPEAVLPVKSEGNIGVDIHVISDDEFKEYRYLNDQGKYEPYNEYHLMPGERKTFSTGLKMEIPKGYGLIFFDRSGLAGKKGLKVLGGVIDQIYKGHQQVVLLNTSESRVDIRVGDRICQAIVVQDIPSKFVDISEEQLTQSSRGEKGFGSSGN